MKPWVIAALAALLVPCAARADVELRAVGQIVRIATVGGLPAQWTSCDGSCEEADSRRQAFAGGDAGGLRWDADQAGQEEVMARVVYAAQVIESPDTVTAVLTSLEPVAGRVLTQRYALSRSTHTLQAELQALPGIGISMSTGQGFVPGQLPGFGAAFSGVDAVRITADGQEEVEAGGATLGQLAVGRTEWMGIRSRFWAWLARPARSASVVVELAGENRPVVAWRTREDTMQFTFYAGPVAWQELREVSDDLPQLLFAALWEPLRWLCFGLYFLLGLIVAGVGNEGLAIVLLSLAVKIILWPLTRIADRWQQDVNRIQSRIQPKLAAIRREFRGEEAHNRTLQVYRDESVHPLYTLKSLAGFAIQVPMFIAAFDMLADNFVLSGARFLWIDDLAAPDRLAALPAVLPFFGGDLNLLPCLMTLVTVLAALMQKDGSLTSDLQSRQRRQLYLMAGAFFLLFYTFPAGMVLYWTANNVWHLLKVQLGRSVLR